MANATIRVKIDFTIDLIHDCENEDILVDFVLDNKEFQDKVLDKINEEFVIESADYELPEPDES